MGWFLYIFPFKSFRKLYNIMKNIHTKNNDRPQKQTVRRETYYFIKYVIYMTKIFVLYTHYTLVVNNNVLEATQIQ